MSTHPDPRDAAAREDRWRNLAALLWVAGVSALVFWVLPLPG